MADSSIEASSQHNISEDVSWERNIAPSSRYEDELLTEDNESDDSLLDGESPKEAHATGKQWRFANENLSSESETSLIGIPSGVLHNLPPLSPPPSSSAQDSTREPELPRTMERHLSEGGASVIDDLHGLARLERRLREDAEARFREALQEKDYNEQKWQEREQRWWNEKAALESRVRDAEAVASVARETAASADEEMRAARSTLRERNAELSQTIAALQNAQESAREMQRQMDMNASQLNGGGRELTDSKINSQLEEIMDKHAVELDRAQGRLSTARAETLNLRAQLQNARHQLQEAKTRAENSEVRVGELEKHLASLKQRVSDSDAAVTQRHLRALDDLHQKMSQCEREVQTLREREQEVQLTATAAAHEAERWKSEWQRAHDELTAVKDALRTKEEEEATWRRLARTEVEADCADEIVKWREKVKALENKHEEETRRIKDACRQDAESRALVDVEQWAKLDGRVQSLTREKEHLAQQLRAVKEDLRSKEAECDALVKHRERDAVSAQAESDDARVTLERKMLQERQILEDEIASLGDTIRGLTQSCDVAADKLAAEKEKVVVLTRELKRMDKEMENLTETVTDHALLQDKQLLRDELRQLQADYAAQGKALHEAKRRLMAVEQDKQAVERDAEAQVREKEVVKSERDRYAREVASYQTLTAQLRKDVAQASSLETIVMDAKQQENQFRAELGHAEEEMRRLQADHKSLVVAYERMRDERDDHARNLSRTVEHNSREHRITMESAERDVSALKRENAVLRATMEKLKDSELREHADRREQEKERIEGQHRDSVQWKNEREHLNRLHESEIRKLKEELSVKLSATATLQRSLAHSAERIALLESERDALAAQTEGLQERHELEILEHREETLKWKETCRAISTQQRKAISHEAFAPTAARVAPGMQSAQSSSHPLNPSSQNIRPLRPEGAPQPHQYVGGNHNVKQTWSGVEGSGMPVHRATRDVYGSATDEKSANPNSSSLMDPRTPPSYYRESGLQQHNGTHLSSGMVYTPTPLKDVGLKRTVNAAKDVLRRPA